MERKPTRNHPDQSQTLDFTNQDVALETGASQGCRAVPVPALIENESRLSLMARWHLHMGRLANKC